MALPVPLLTGQRIIAAMGMIEERRLSHNIVQFIYEDILRDREWFLYYGFLIYESKRVE